MKFAFLVLACALAAVAAAQGGLRNPFWPIGYVGETSPISADVRAKPKPKLPPPRPVSPATAPGAVAGKPTAVVVPPPPPTEVTREEWVQAKRSLKLGNLATFEAADGSCTTTININGNIYANGDLMSITFKDVRFTWRIKGLGESETLKLVRVKAHRLESVKRPEPMKKRGDK